MVSTYTPNIDLEEPARGDYVGTWDTPVNNNTTVIDLALGAVTSISLNNSPVVLASAQFQSNTISFGSTLTGNVAITFPTTFKKPYSVGNFCTGSSAFVVTLQTTAAGGQIVAIPPGEFVDVINDGTHIKFRNLGRVGSFMDYAGSSVPAWISNCTVPPYLNCDGSAFSSATYPQLAIILGGTTLPDTRGRVRAPLNQGSNRLLSSYGGVDGNTNLAVGGQDNIVLTSSQIPANIPNTAVSAANPPGYIGTGINGTALSAGGTNIPVTTSSLVIGTSVTINPSGGSFHSNVQPTYVAGLALIRAG